MENQRLHFLFTLLKQELKASNSSLFDAFTPGLPKADSLAKLASLKLGDPELLLSFYELTNGIKEFKADKDFGEISLFPLAVYNSLEEAIESYTYYALEHSHWEKGLFPIFSSGFGDFYLLDLRREEKTNGMIWLFSPISFTRFGRPATVYDSLETLFETLVQLYRQQGYYHSPDLTTVFSSGPYRHSNAKLEIEIAKALNPRSEHWTSE